MDHTLAQQTNTLDKYLLNELTLDERAVFEEHMFDCADCAAKVQDDFAMISDLKSVLAEPRPIAAAQAAKPSGGWREWFRPMMLAPTFATLALAGVLGYQNLVSIPRMLEPQVLDSTPMVAATRGTNGQSVGVKPGAALFAATFEVAAQKAAPAYVCEFQADGKGVILTLDCGKHATAEFALNLLLPADKFPAGGYTMILRPAAEQNGEVSRYSFAVRIEK